MYFKHTNNIKVGKYDSAIFNETVTPENFDELIYDIIGDSPILKTNLTIQFIGKINLFTDQRFSTFELGKYTILRLHHCYFD
jgi:hypothetical protein